MQSGTTRQYPTLGQYIPDVWIYVQERAVRMGRLEIYNNFSPYMVDDSAKHVLFSVEYFCSEGDAFWRMDDKSFIDKCIGELNVAGIISGETKILDATCTRTLKAYPAYFGSYAEFGKVREWLDGFENLYCIGRNGQHRYNNMDHSMMCGMKAARGVVSCVVTAFVSASRTGCGKTLWYNMCQKETLGNVQTQRDRESF